MKWTCEVNVPSLKGGSTLPGFLEWYGGVCLALIFLASLTGSQAFRYSEVHSRPPVPFSKSLHQLVPPQVPQRMVHISYNLGTGRYWGYIYPSVNSCDGAHQDLEFVLVGPVEGLKLLNALFIELVGGQKACKKVIYERHVFSDIRGPMGDNVSLAGVAEPGAIVYV